MKDISSIACEYFNAPMESIAVKTCNAGDVNTSYIASYAGGRVYIKIQDKPGLPALYQGQIEREVTGLKLCTKVGIPYPKVLKYDFSNRYIITEYLDFPLLSHVWGGLDEREKENMKHYALDIVKKINSIQSSTFGGIYEGSGIKFKTWPECYVHLMNTAVKDCLNYGTLNQAEADIILGAAKRNAECLNNSETACLNHLDLHWNNIFVTGKPYKIAGVIDFGSALYAPYYMDLFRLDGGFLYGTESFYKDGDSLKIDKNQRFCADLFNTVDYYVFLSFTGQESGFVKERLIDICMEY
jgi:hypothetical protein